MATPGNRDLTSAYADLVAGVLDARSDAASQAFDAEVAAAESEGRIDARTARALRWWQRESLRALVEHAHTALPPALAAVGQAQADGGRGAADAAEAWARAVGDSLSDPSTADPVVHEPMRAAAAAQPGGELPPTPMPTPPDLRERRRRLIVAGLSPLPREE